MRGDPRDNEQYGPCWPCQQDVAAVLIDPRGGQLAGMYYERYHLTPAQEAAHRIGGSAALKAYAVKGKLTLCLGKRYGR